MDIAWREGNAHNIRAKRRWMRSPHGALAMLTNANIASLLRLAAREMSGTVAPAIAGSYPVHVAKTLGIMLDEIALAVTARDKPLPVSEADRTADLASLLHTEIARADAEAKAITGAQEQDDAMIAASAAPVTLDQINACLATIPARPAGRATGITRLPGGFSKETYMIAVAGARDLVLRRDMPFGPVLGAAADEAGLLSHLHARGIAVAPVLLAEHRPEVLGRSFMFVERMDGENAGDVARRDAVAAREIALDLAQILGAVHAIDPRDVGMVCADDPRAAVRTYLASWRDYWIERRLEDAPFLTAALNWLLDHVPEDIERLVIVHGDARPDNMLAHSDGSVTAMLDWEFQHCGDAAEDVEYAWNFVQDFIPREVFLETYLAAGGVRYSAQNADFYAVWRAVRNLICLDAGWSGFVNGPYPVFALGAPRLLFRRHLIRDLAASIAVVTPATAHSA